MGNDNVQVWVDNKVGLVNGKGLVIKPEFKSVYSISDNVFLCNINDTCIFAFIMSENKMIRDTCRYIEANNRLLFLTIKEKVVIYNMLLHIFLKDTFDLIYEINEKQTLARKGNMCFILDEDGQHVTNIGKWERCSFISDDIISVTQNNLSGMANKKGELLSKLAYSYIQPIFEKKRHCTYYRIDTLYGIINAKGKEITPPIYTYLHEPYYSFPLGYCIVVQNGKYGLLNAQGKQIIPPLYDTIANFDEGFVCVKLNKKFGLLNSKGEVAIPFEYDNSFIFTKTGKAYVTKDGKSYWINRKNKTVVSGK